VGGWTCDQQTQARQVIDLLPAAVEDKRVTVDPFEINPHLSDDMSPLQSCYGHACA
jgi:hypothetical protein